jgi:hypothetical protein
MFSFLNPDLINRIEVLLSNGEHTRKTVVDVIYIYASAGLDYNKKSMILLVG